MHERAGESARVKKFIGIFLAVSLFMSMGFAASFAADASDAAAATDQFKVVGYYSGSLFDEPLDRLQTDKLTHIVYAFLIPQEDGGLVPLEKPTSSAN